MAALQPLLKLYRVSFCVCAHVFEFTYPKYIYMYYISHMYCNCTQAAAVVAAAATTTVARR